MGKCSREISLRANKKYLVVVALLAVLAVVFGLAGTVAPPLAESPAPAQSSSSSSSSVGHFMNPPTFDSGWVDITDKCGQYFNITHNLNTKEVFVDITGKQSQTGGEHQRNLGGTGVIPGWSRVYTGALSSIAHSLVQTSDGGYAIAGTTNYLSTPTEGDFWLVKTDWNGNMQWNKTYGHPPGPDGSGGLDAAYSVIQTSDGGYALAGETWARLPFVRQNDFWLVKTDAAGNMTWNKTYGGTNWDAAYSVIQTSDGGYALAGSSPELNLIKTDANGNQQWNKTYEGGYFRSVVQMSDGGYALAGANFRLVKTDSAGNIQWNKTYGGADTRTFSLIKTSDGGYALAGNIGDIGLANDFLLVKVDSAGNMQWNKEYGGAGDDRVYSVIQTSDGGYALAGYTGSYGAGSVDFWLVKTDVVGNMQWNKTYGALLVDEARALVQTSDGEYVLAGGTNMSEAWFEIPGIANPITGADFWLVKTDTESGLAWISLTNTTITLYRGKTDLCWNLVRVQMWLIKEPSWIYGDINMDGAVDYKDLYILARNYGKTFSALSLSGLIAIGGIHTYRKRKRSDYTENQKRE